MTEQEKDLDELFNMYYHYLYKYIVRRPEDFKPEVWLKEGFKEELEYQGYAILANDGY